MKAVQLTGFKGVESLEVVNVSIPKPLEDEILIKVKAAGINYAEVEQIQGNYLTFGKEVPFVMGFEVAGVVLEVGSAVTNIFVGDLVTGFSESGGFAEYSTAKADAVFPIPKGLSYGQATTIPIQGMTAYTILKYLVLPKKPKSILIQAAAGGVGLYLIQLATYFKIPSIIALASSAEKLAVVKSLGATTLINYETEDWVEQVKIATNEEGVDVVLQMLLGSIGEESFKLLAPDGQIVLFGSKNYNDTVTTNQVRQLIWQNQTLTGFAYPALPVKKIKESIPELLTIINEGHLKVFATHSYTFENAKDAFNALAARGTIGKVFFDLQ